MKKIVPVLIILLLLGVGGYFFMNSKGIVPKVPVETANKNTGANNVFTSIKDAISKSISLKCVYKDEKGVETTTYIKGGAVRVMMQRTSTTNEEPNSIILKDKKMYMWNDTTKNGFTFVMTEPKVSPSADSVKAPASENKDEAVLAEIEKYKNSCKTEVITDSFFTPPTDVKFQDMSAFTNSLMKQVPTIEVTGEQNVVNQDYINEMLKKQGVNQ